MKKYVFFLASLFFLLYCCSTATSQLDKWEPYDESEELAANATHAVSRMQYKRIQSKHSDRNALFLPFEKELTQFTQTEYEALKNLILEQDILSIQGSIGNGSLTYESLTLFYLYRIYHFELQRETYLNAIIALNPNVLKEAREKDRKRKADITHPIYGMPILLKDNINALPMATTAGAAAFRENTPQRDAFLVKQLKAKGALILGKVNLSEWAYYFCQGCPLGYSAMGGQTLNPYGRKQFETGGSSSGSGVAVAANYTVAAIGSETSGSILSPSGKNSVVGLKPTIGAVSRSGVVPISSTLDTAGPMTKNVLDNAILMSAITGEDNNDSYSYASQDIRFQGLDTIHLKGKRLGLIRNFSSDSLMQIAVKKMEAAGAIIIPFDPPKTKMNQFRTILDVDMKKDFPLYIQQHGSKTLDFDSVKDIVSFNQKDSLLHAPYGQGIFERIAQDTTSATHFESTKLKIMQEARTYFEIPMRLYELDAVLSIDNRSASYAAAAHYPALGVPMGYRAEGQPQNITFIAPSKQEQKLLEIGAAFERLTKARKPPKGYH
ncbi:MAG: amidase family protein [Flavobacteriaceae bacterium]|nr:amidase family protein [Flavobacteriaceae bacterium]MDG2503531.1 amidase family protein [Flavobacteriaceae bacterium]